MNPVSCLCWVPRDTGIADCSNFKWMYCILHYLINIVMEKVSGLISFSYLHVSVDQIKNYIYTVYLQMIILTAERGSINHTNEIICLEYLYFFY